jgi:aspartate/methionine/tyrosine aminotransferase
MKQFKPSVTAVIGAQADQMRKSGIHVFNFAAGDPILANHPALLEAANRALREGMSPYAPIAGLLELRTRAADWMNDRYQAHYDVRQTMVTCGGKFGIYAALQILLEPGDEVLIAAPYWVSYPEMVRLGSGIPRVILTSPSSNWKVTPQSLQAHVTNKSKVLILNNACNPTGVIYSRTELVDLLLVAAKANLIVISDEVYSELVFDKAEFVSCASFPEHRSRVIVIESCSKNFAMAGWRVGFAFGPEEIVSRMIALQSQSTTGTALISQKTAIGALLHARAVSTYVHEAMDLRRQLFYQTFNRLFSTNHCPAPSSLYFFAKIKGSSVKFCEEILEHSRVALVPGIGFGVEEYVRFAFTETEDQIVKGLEALRSVTRIFCH